MSGSSCLPSMHPSPAQIYVLGNSLRISSTKGAISSPVEQRVWKYKKAVSTVFGMISIISSPSTWSPVRPNGLGVTCGCAAVTSAAHGRTGATVRRKGQEGFRSKLLPDNIWAQSFASLHKYVDTMSAVKKVEQFPRLVFFTLAWQDIVVYAYIKTECT